MHIYMYAHLRTLIVHAYTSHPLHASVEESVTEEKMSDLYKEYKGEEKAEKKTGK